MSQIELTADVTGTVAKVAAAVGTQVAADEPVLILESMKMEIPVSAPVAGKVLDIKVAEGDAVEEGQVVAIFLPDA